MNRGIEMDSSDGNDINALRVILFETLRGIQDGSLDVDKARAINQTASVIIDTAKVKVAHMKIHRLRAIR